jgi:XTP/dITP diphosphohydrolase
MSTTDFSSSSMEPMVTVVVSTNNLGKLAELRSLYAELPIEWIRPSDILSGPWSVVEDGTTFEQNAILKAMAACKATGYIALADDSGLEVDVLGGMPGVLSARFSGASASDDDNNQALLQALSEHEPRARAARFCCVLAVVTPWSQHPILAEGTCEGHIGHHAQGSGGFGYDPLFLVDHCAGRSMAELTPDEKNAVSHRGRAARQLRPALAGLVQGLTIELESLSCVVGRV